MNEIKISFGEDFSTVKNKSVQWEDLVKRLGKHKKAERKGGPYFIGGYFEGTKRKSDKMVARTLLTIDIDKVEMDVDDVEFELLMSIRNAFCAYSTYSHGEDGKASVRVVLPLSREVTPDEYRVLSEAFVKQISLPVDACTFKPNQAMFLPTCREGAEVWAVSGQGEPVDVDQYLKESKAVSVSADDDFEHLLAEQPLDLSEDEINAYLDAYHADGLDYDQWLTVGAAINHQFKGSKVGYDKWVAWSAKSDKHDESQMEIKWRSFGDTHKPVTFASIIYFVREAGGISGVNPSGLEALLEEASTVVDLDDYREFKTKVAKTPDVILQNDDRSMLAARLHEAFGKSNGITKGDIKKALTHKKSRSTDSDAPAWMDGWVYIESTCEFHNSQLHYSIKREAFNAKYDREIECAIAEKSASQLALVDHKIPTVVDTMFFPGAGELFEFEGRTMLNTFYSKGVEACERLDEEGRACVETFLKHVEMTIEREDERTIFLDWLCHVVQNPGDRVNWALLLQGAQGTGKTYFVNVLQRVMGDHVKNLDPSSIAGRFTGWGHGAIVNAVEEIRISGTNRYEVLDRMKPFITNDTIMVEEKGRDHRTVPNFTSYLLLTNYIDAVPLVEGDRRYCVLFSRAQSERQLYTLLGGRDGAEAYFNKLFSDLDKRPDALSYYLTTRKISDEFAARGRAPETSARRAMIEMAISPEREAVEEAISEHECEVINERVLDVTWLNELCVMNGKDLPPSRVFASILLDMGYRRVEGRKVKTRDRKNRYVWITEDINDYDAKQLVREFHGEEIDIFD